MKLRLGEVTFDSETRQLLRGASEIHLSPKAFDLLKLLVDHRPRVLSKRELHERLWPATFVSEANLTSLVAEVREAYSSRRPRFIRTAHRVGYAFCGEAAAVQEPDASKTPTAYCWLVMKDRKVPLQAGENILGRDVDVIDVQSPTVSRRHARIVVGDTEVLLEDLGSKNGSAVCGNVVSGGLVRLKDGDEIRTGSVVFHFRMTPRAGATATWSGADRRAPGARSVPRETGSRSQRSHPIEDDGDTR